MKKAGKAIVIVIIVLVLFLGLSSLVITRENGSGSKPQASLRSDGGNPAKADSGI